MKPIALDTLVDGFCEISNTIQKNKEWFETIKVKAQQENPWFIPEFIEEALQNIANSFCQKELLNLWIQSEAIIENDTPKKIGLITAGNIPAVGFHDLLCCLITGNQVQLKCSEKDQVILHALVNILISQVPALNEKIQFVQKLEQYDAIIATGSNASKMVFKNYFGTVPHLLRGHRNSIGILQGNETPKELEGFADDIMMYFGMGCRNISRIFVPKGYQFDALMKAIQKYQFLTMHSRYMNNWEYQNAIHIMTQAHVTSNALIHFKEDTMIPSPITVVHYTTYENLDAVITFCQEQTQNIQCIISSISFESLQVHAPGTSQSPLLMEYSDNINTIRFLQNL